MMRLSSQVGQLAVVTTVAGLAAAPPEGALAEVTDANSTVRLAVVAGGGANHVLVRFNGTNWLIV